MFNFVGHNGIVRSLDFHPTEEIICSSDSSVIKVWDLKQHATIKEFMVSLTLIFYYSNWITSTHHRSRKYNDLYKNELQAGGSLVRFQPGSGRHLAVANQNVITVLDLRDPEFQINLQVSFKYRI